MTGDEGPPAPTESAAIRANRRICALFDACREAGTARGTRDAALLSVLYGADVARRRALRLDRAAFHAPTGRLRCGDRVALAVEGARDALRDWVALRGRAPGPLFCRVVDGVPDPDRPLPSGGVDAVLDRWAEAAGVEGVRPDEFRRLYRSPWWRAPRTG